MCRDLIILYPNADSNFRSIQIVVKVGAVEHIVPVRFGAGRYAVIETTDGRLIHRVPLIMDGRRFFLILLSDEGLETKMRAVVQRVLEASVHVVESERSQRLKSEIGFGLVILLGISNQDAVEQAASLADKIATLRIFEDADGRMNRSLIDVRGSALVVSNFTLYGDCRKGRRPSFTDAASGPQAEALYRAFGEALASPGLSVAYGEFGAEMRLRLTNDGPVTLLIDTSKAF